MVARPQDGNGLGGPDEHPAEHPEADLPFVDVPRLELDQLLEQIVERAEEVMATQSRLRGLLRAHRAVGADLELPTVLRRVVTEARALVGARYAALGVLGADGRLVEFLHEGMADEDVRAIGRPPRGEGLLGALIDDPRPIRLPDLHDDPRFAGFPPGHPPMASFLGVPIRVRDAVFGNLYLTDRRSGDGFSADDEELVQALATSAAAAIENAVLFAETRRRQTWQAAAAQVATDLLAGEEPAEVLEGLLATVRELSDSDGAALLVPVDSSGEASGGAPYHEPDEFLVAVAEGESVARVENTRLRAGDSEAGRALMAGRPVATSDAARDPRLTGVPLTRLDVGPALVAPLTAAGAPRGALVVTRRRDRSPYRREELDAVVSLAAHAGLVTAYARVRLEQELRRRLDDRDRIADDLRTSVIGELLAVATDLTGLAGSVTSPVHRSRLLGQADRLDRVARGIGSSVFDLNRREDGGG
ncbi:GAF domain-containing protein [Pseudonocardia sp. RS010]|uniref:GAF domain-containing protein n=1 Tax=Pseudonocardia sp. RS010 TaxID=3385979 RepID=UPI0039A0FBAA